MNILLIGERFSNNLGDGVIYEVVQKMIEKIYDNLTIYCLDISGNTKFKLGLEIKVKSNMIKPIKKKISKIKRNIFLKKNLKNIDLTKIDGAIFVGGQIFSNYFSNAIYLISKELNKNEVPVIFNSCGLGLNSIKSRKKIQKSLNYKNVKAISIRDNVDKFEKEININKEIIYTFDPVIELNQFLNPNRKKSEILGIGLMEPNLYIHNNIKINRDEYFNIIKDIINQLEYREIEWEFFCNGNLEDYNFIKEVCKRNGYSNDKICSRPKLPKELIDTITRYNSIISFRLHSHIIATALDIPSMGFYWDKKVSDFAKIINKEEYFLDLNIESMKNLNNTLKKFIEKKDKNFYELEKLIDTKLDSVFLKNNKFEELKK